MRGQQRRLFERGGGTRKRRGYGWKKGTDERIKASGEFAERLVQHVLGGVRSEDGSERCDLWHDGFNAGIESKLGSNRDGVKVRERQLDSHLSLLDEGFPYAQYWYTFLKYRNSSERNGGAAQRLFQELVQCDADVPRFFGRHTTGLYVLDISIIDAIRNKQGATTEIWRSNGVSLAVRIGWRFFDWMRDAPDGALRALGLRLEDYYFDARSIETTFAGHEMAFPFLALLGADFRKAEPTSLFSKERTVA